MIYTYQQWHDWPTGTLWPESPPVRPAKSRHTFVHWGQLEEGQNIQDPAKSRGKHVADKFSQGLVKGWGRPGVGSPSRSALEELGEGADCCSPSETWEMRPYCRPSGWWTWNVIPPLRAGATVCQRGGIRLRNHAQAGKLDYVGKHMFCMWKTQASSLELHDPLSTTRVIPVCQIRSRPWALQSVAPKPNWKKNKIT